MIQSYETALLKTLVSVTQVARKTENPEEAAVAARYETRFLRRLAKLTTPKK